MPPAGIISETVFEQGNTRDPSGVLHSAEWIDSDEQRILCELFYHRPGMIVWDVGVPIDRLDGPEEALRGPVYCGEMGRKVTGRNTDVEIKCGNVLQQGKTHFWIVARKTTTYQDDYRVRGDQSQRGLYAPWRQDALEQLCVSSAFRVFPHRQLTSTGSAMQPNFILQSSALRASSCCPASSRSTLSTPTEHSWQSRAAARKEAPFLTRRKSFR